MKMCASTDFYRHVFPDAEPSLSPVTYGVTTYTWNVNAGGGEETADPAAAPAADPNAVPAADPNAAAPADTTAVDPNAVAAPEG